MKTFDLLNGRLLLATCDQVQQFLVEQIGFLGGDHFEDPCLHSLGAHSRPLGIRRADQWQQPGGRHLNANLDLVVSSTTDVSLWFNLGDMTLADMGGRLSLPHVYYRATPIVPVDWSRGQS